MQEIMKEIRQGIVGRALEETGPRVQQCLGDLTIMSSFAEPLRELMFGESVEDVRLLNIFEMQTVWDTILGKYFLDLLRGEGIEGYRTRCNIGAWDLGLRLGAKQRRW